MIVEVQCYGSDKRMFLSPMSSIKQNGETILQKGENLIKIKNKCLKNNKCCVWD